MISIAVDIGGTFTDVCASVTTSQGNELYWAKVPSTPNDFSEGVVDATTKILETCGGGTRQVTRFLHATTVATNAVLEERGACIGILMTEGFEDTLEMGRQLRSQMYKMDLDPETPVFLAPARRRFGISERISATGEELMPLDEEGVRTAVRMLRGEADVDAIAVCYLFSFASPIHEQRTRDLIQAEYPDLHVVLSHEIDPVFREYERLCVTAFDAYLRPVIHGYVRTLKEKLESIGLEAELLTMQSRGGLTSALSAIDKPVTSLLSGPAAGVIGAKFIAETSGYTDVITLDMGGTSADIALIKGGQPTITNEGAIRGYPLRMPMVEVNTIGAGGGSIAWIDTAGGLRVGPQSAGANPGPACYGMGGQEPTVSDASLVMGYLHGDSFAGGEVPLDQDAAYRAVEKVGKRLGLSVQEAAYGIHRVVNAKMADAIRLVSVRRGFDPRHLALLAFGGAGPINGGLLSRELAIPVELVPEAPGVASAFGLLVSNIEHDMATTFVSSADGFDQQRAVSIFRQLDEAGLERMKHEGAPLDEVVRIRSADMRYTGQSYELEVPISPELLQGDVQSTVEAFHATHRSIYGHANDGSPVEFVNLRLVMMYPLPSPSLSRTLLRGKLADAQVGNRPCYFGPAAGFVDTPVFERTRLPINGSVRGPAIVQQRDTTTVVYPGQVCEADKNRNLVLRWGEP